MVPFLNPLKTLKWELINYLFNSLILFTEKCLFLV